jgi:prepilin-type processing-associated H-X9-DG protein
VGDAETAEALTGTYPYYWKHIGNSFYNFDAPNNNVPDPIAEQQGKARHSAQINVIWLDGHAKAVAYDRLVNDPGLTVGSTTSIWDPYKTGCVN